MRAGLPSSPISKGEPDPSCRSVKQQRRPGVSGRPALMQSGGAGIRTPVRDWIDHSFYVRISSFRVSVNWPMSRRFPDKPSELSPDAGRRSAGLSRYCDTHNAASGRLHHGQVL